MSNNNPDTIFIIATLDLKKYENDTLEIYTTEIYENDIDTLQVKKLEKSLTASEIWEQIESMRNIHNFNKVALYTEINLGYLGTAIVSKLTINHVKNITHDYLGIYTETNNLLNNQEKCDSLNPNNKFLSSELIPNIKSVLNCLNINQNLSNSASTDDCTILSEEKEQTNRSFLSNSASTDDRDEKKTTNHSILLSFPETVVEQSPPQNNRISFFSSIFSFAKTCINTNSIQVRPQRIREDSKNEHNIKI